MLNITKVYLLNVPLESDYKHTLYFEDAEAQSRYFSSKVAWYFDDFSYQRKDNYIRVPVHFDAVFECNYVMYQNKAYNNKWFYAFITDIKYVNDERTDIYIETDVIQTYMFNYRFNHCLIEREHVNDDTIGLHTLPEQLETGEYICDGKYKYEPLTNNVRYVVGSTRDLRKHEVYPKNLGCVQGRVPNGFCYYYFKSQIEVADVLYDVDEAGMGDAIICVFSAPTDFLNLGETENSASLVIDTYAPVTKKWSESEIIYKPSTVNGYTPKNKKLLTFPYCSLMVSNNAGSNAVYNYEFFNGDKCDFNINFVLTPGCSIRLIPLNYKGISENNEEGLTGGKFPVGGWDTDVYINWLTQNSINISAQKESVMLQYAGGLAATAGGFGMIATGAGAVAGAGAIAGGALTVGNALNSYKSIAGEKYAHSLQSPQAKGNLNSGDVTCSNGDLTFTAYKMSIRKEYAKIIDSFFNCFGYQVNRVGIPNKNHRKHYWYTKTAGCEINGAIPQDELQKIKSVYDNGITFWRDPLKICNYDLDNSIV